MQRIWNPFFFAVVLILVPVCLAGQQTPVVQPAAATELIPIVVDNGKQEGEVVLSVNLDAGGSVAQSSPVSGPDKLYGAAEKVTRMFNHKQLSGASGATQHVYFWKNEDGMKKTAPVYPPIAKLAHVLGTVQLIASVAADGHVTQVVPVSGPPMLIGSAKDAVAQWIYLPLLQNGSAVAFYAVVDVHYDVNYQVH
jgi:outer membrane biosynthesis protein TonB